MNAFVALLARVGLIAAFLAALYAQVVVLPGFLRQGGSEGIDWVHPYAVAAMVGLLCVEVVLVSAWMLLGRARRGELLTKRAVRWIDVVIAATAVATLLAAAATVHLATTDATVRASVRADEFRIAFLLLCAGIGFGALMLVLRRLLRRAAELKAEMAEVI
ncbi:DUF2975 domain-containing protein [Glycomyces tritici]|uniref:DUF2975 domain-containing protein n=1 Tax=Glycomyces tritici TaxID=2665176 RepID=A0ABT7YTT7_9ACTN|nr:DUF2975 domain-containing protein [Glycomyces tritici]MDN3242012.1 DUF2975 domain-containing protein [Glycomyces tritici]